MSNLIVSIKEARELLGKAADKMSDDEIEHLIINLDVIARETIRSYLHRNDNQAINEGDSSNV